MAETAKKIVITGGAGMIGQNLLTLLESRGHTNLTVIDRHPTNHTIVRQFHPSVRMVQADLTTPGPWQELAKTEDVGELFFAGPAALLDDDPARPDEPSAEREKGDPEECGEQRDERRALGRFSLIRHFTRVRRWTSNARGTTAKAARRRTAE